MKKTSRGSFCTRNQTLAVKQGRIATTRWMEMEHYCDIIENVTNKDVTEDLITTITVLYFVQEPLPTIFSSYRMETKIIF